MEITPESAIDDSFVNFKKFWDEVNRRKIIEKKAQEAVEKKEREAEGDEEKMNNDNEESDDGENDSCDDAEIESEGLKDESIGMEEVVEGDSQSVLKAKKKKKPVKPVLKVKKKKPVKKTSKNKKAAEDKPDLEDDESKNVQMEDGAVNKLLNSKKPKKKVKKKDGTNTGKAKVIKQINSEDTVIGKEAKQENNDGVNVKKKKTKKNMKNSKSNLKDNNGSLVSKDNEGKKKKKKQKVENLGKDDSSKETASGGSKKEKKVKTGKKKIKETKGKLKKKGKSVSDGTQNGSETIEGVKSDDSRMDEGNDNDWEDLDEQLVSIDNMFNQAELNLKRKLKRKLQKLGINANDGKEWTKVKTKKKNMKTKSILPKIEEFDFTVKKNEDNIDEGLERARTLEDMDRLQKKTEVEDKLQKAVKTLGNDNVKDSLVTGGEADQKRPPKPAQVDPSKFLQVCVFLCFCFIYSVTSFYQAVKSILHSLFEYLAQQSSLFLILANDNWIVNMINNM